MIVIRSPVTECRYESQTQDLFLNTLVSASSLILRHCISMLQIIAPPHDPGKIPFSRLHNGYTQTPFPAPLHHTPKRFYAITQAASHAHLCTAWLKVTPSIQPPWPPQLYNMASSGEHPPSLPSVDDLPADIRDLLENYSGVKSEDVVAHIVDVVCTNVLCMCRCRLCWGDL